MINGNRPVRRASRSSYRMRLSLPVGEFLFSTHLKLMPRLHRWQIHLHNHFNKDASDMHTRDQFYFFFFFQDLAGDLVDETADSRCATLSLRPLTCDDMKGHR